MSIKHRFTKLQFRLLIPIAIVSLKWIGVQLTMDLFCHPKKFKRNKAIDNITGARMILRALKQTVEETSINGNCLSRSIVLQRLLRNNGISSEIKIGVAKMKNKFKAHAWVEHQGIPLNAGKKVRTRYTTVEGYRITEGLEFS